MDTPKVALVINNLNITEHGLEALNKAELLTEDTKTDIINRALQVYAFTLEHDMFARDRDKKTSEIYTVKFE